MHEKKVGKFGNKQMEDPKRYRVSASGIRISASLLLTSLLRSTWFGMLHVTCDENDDTFPSDGISDVPHTCRCGGVEAEI